MEIAALRKFALVSKMKRNEVITNSPLWEKSRKILIIIGFKP